MEIVDINSCWLPWTHATFALYNNVSVWRLIQVHLASTLTENAFFQLLGVNIVVLQLLYLSGGKLLILSTTASSAAASPTAPLGAQDTADGSSSISPGERGSAESRSSETLRFFRDSHIGRGSEVLITSGCSSTNKPQSWNYTNSALPCCASDSCQRIVTIIKQLFIINSRRV